MPNTLAYIVLFGWPVIVYVLFRRLPPAAALGWAVVAGYLLLPTRTGIDLPVIPAIDKDGVPVLSSALMLLLGVGGASAGRRNRMEPTERRGSRSGWIIKALLVVFFVSPTITVLTNPEPVIVGPLFIPGLKLYDAASIFASFAINILPFLLAWRLFASPEGHVQLLRILVFALLGYSLLVLFEIRMSPQLNRTIYGFFPHSFLQHIRAGGFRPVVFLHHGLWLAILVAMAAIGAGALWREKIARGERAGKWLFAAIFILIVLSLSNSLGALAITLILLPAVLILGVRGQLLLASAVAITVLLYPMFRGAELLPVDLAVSISASIDQERAASLTFRLDNEKALLEKANEKPFTGWGNWGRNQIFAPETGEQISVTDGTWIIIIGSFGWLGYLAQFGLLTLPIILLAFRRTDLGLTQATSGLAIALAANLIDLTLNATLTPVTWLIAGALMGRYTYYQAQYPEEPSKTKNSAPAWMLPTMMH